MQDHVDPRERAWHVTARWTELRGELTANVVRLAGAGGFYAIHLVDYWYWSQRTEADAIFHRRATIVAIVAVALGAAVMLLLRKQVFPAWLKYATTGVDLLLITFLAAFGSKLDSPIVYAYFALLGVAAIRMRPPLIACTTIAGVAAMFALYAVMRSNAGDGQTPAISFRPVDLAGMTLSYGLLGAALGQTVRQAKRICREYASRVDLIEGLEADSPRPVQDRAKSATSSALQAEDRS